MATRKTFNRVKQTALQTGLKHGFRSGLEDAFAAQLQAAGVSYTYESFKVHYVSPERKHTYTPDFRLPNGIIIETKGRFMVADRQKHLLIQAQHPELDIRFVFTRSKTPISKTSTTTYADWCRKNGYLFADKAAPEAWLKEPPP